MLSVSSTLRCDPQPSCDGVELGYYVVSDGTPKPYRVKARAPSFHNISVLPEISKGCMVADMVAIIGSVDIVMGEVDR